jgi:hypothetical protein
VRSFYFVLFCFILLFCYFIYILFYYFSLFFFILGKICCAGLGSQPLFCHIALCVLYVRECSLLAFSQTNTPLLQREVHLAWACSPRVLHVFSMVRRLNHSVQHPCSCLFKNSMKSSNYFYRLSPQVGWRQPPIQLLDGNPRVF